MNRRQALWTLGVGLPLRVTAQATSAYTILGSGPTILAFDREPRGYFDELAKKYRVVVIHEPSNASPPQTAEEVNRAVLTIADAAGAPRFAWYGFSWGAVVGLQLATQTDRITALACGGWPPLGGQYRETLAYSESQNNSAVTYYRSIRGWPERESVSKLSCPRFVFAGTNDQFNANGQQIRIGPIIAERRQELQRLGWKVRLIEGFGHELGGRPDIITPLLREFLDPIQLP
jgi:hypothetical protein